MSVINKITNIRKVLTMDIFVEKSDLCKVLTHLAMYSEFKCTVVGNNKSMIDSLPNNASIHLTLEFDECADMPEVITMLNNI